MPNQMLKKIKVALVLNTAWNIYNFRMGILESFAEQGAELIVIAPSDSYVELIKAKVKCRFISLKKLDRCGTNIWKDAALLFELYQIYKREQIDIALQYTIKLNIYGSFAGKLAGTKTISTVTGLGISFLHNNLVNKVVRRLYKLAFRATDRVAFQNNADRYFFLGAGLVRKNKTVLIEGSGINTNDFKSTNYPPKNSETIRFLYLGRLMFYKGIKEYLESARRIVEEYKQVEFCVLGGYDEENPQTISKIELDQFTEHPRIKYLGVKDDVRPIMASADALVLPSDSEGIAKSLLEALAMKLPIITTDIPGCQETIEHNVNGLKISHRDTNLVYHAIKQMIEIGAERRKEMGEAGRKMALRRFDEKIIVGNYLRLVNQIMMTNNDEWSRKGKNNVVTDSTQKT